MQQTISLQNEQKTIDFGRQLAALIRPPLLIFLEGNLGTGKTTLVRGLLQALDWKDKVKSPTYTLIETYSLPAMTIYHCDLYRLKTADELQEIGFEEYYKDKNAIILIEWPEIAKDLLPPPDVRCVLSYENAGRKLSLITATPRGTALLQPLTKHWPD